MPDPKRIHDIKEFIQFFEAIPDEDWCVGHTHCVIDGKHKYCAYGHLQRQHQESSYWLDIFPVITRLVNILRPEVQWHMDRLVNHSNNYITRLNDGMDSLDKRYGNHPKTRMLTALKLCLERESRSQTSATAEV